MGVEGSILVLFLVLVLVFLLVMGVVVKGTILRDLKTFIDDGYYKSQRERELCISISTDYLNLYFYIWKEKEKVLLGFWVLWFGTGRNNKHFSYTLLQFPARVYIIIIIIIIITNKSSSHFFYFTQKKKTFKKKNQKSKIENLPIL